MFRPSAFLILLFLVFFQIGSAHGLEYHFIVDAEGWQPGGDFEEWGVVGGKLRAGSSSTNPYIVSPLLNIDADKLSVMSIRLKNDGLYQQLRVFWSHPYDDRFVFQRSVPLSQAGPGKFRTYYIDLSKQPGWELIIARLAIVPMEGPGTFEIDSIKLEEPNLLNRVLIFWQGFFRLEKLKASTVNFIYGPKIGQLSVNLYIYLLVAAAFAFFAFKIGIMSNPAEVFKKTLIVVFALWLILDLRIVFDHLRNGYLDWMQFAGKDLDGKRAAATLGDYYEFLEFCNEKLPPRSKIEFSSHSPYLFEKGQYYLYSHLRSDDPDYLLVYAEAVKESASWEVFARFDESSYILKRVRP